MAEWVEMFRGGSTFLIALVVEVCHVLAVFAIAVGVSKALWIFLKDLFFGLRSMAAARESRLELGHAFSLALGFLIGASILSTAVAPDWSAVGKLAAIIAIRTGLNHVLLMEMKREANLPVEMRFVTQRPGMEEEKMDA